MAKLKSIAIKCVKEVNILAGENILTGDTIKYKARAKEDVPVAYKAKNMIQGRYFCYGVATQDIVVGHAGTAELIFLLIFFMPL